MKKYVVRNCPACMEVIETDCTHTYCCTDNRNAYCKNVPDCLLKRIVSLCKENQFFSYGAIMFENGLSADILNLLEIEEVE